jgi:hypothetical protein
MPNFDDLYRVRDEAMRSLMDARVRADNAQAAANLARARAVDAEYPVNDADKAIREYVYKNGLFRRDPAEGDDNAD